jgi:iron complex transport system substrate-binding protein
VRLLVVTVLGAVALGLATSAAGQAPTRVVEDSTGRRVEVPARIERVFAAGAPASILVYAVAPDRLLGWVRPLSPQERQWVPERYAALPALGRLTGRGSTANVEAVLATRADVVLDYGQIGPTYVSLAERVQRQTGVPVLLFDGRLSTLPQVLQVVGDLLGVPERGRAMARYAARILAEVDQRVARVPPERRPHVYYGRGPGGLETGLPGAINVESFERLGARNVALERAGGLVRVSVEQVLVWDPEVIVTIDPEFAAAVRREPVWRGVRAVRDGRVYLAPVLPFPWLDFPPSVNRLIGLKWLGQALYPELFPEDLREEARAFYALFYHRAPSDDQLDTLLGPPRPRR